MRLIKIKEPIWHTHSVGIADRKITKDLKVRILYKTREGSKLYPNDFFISKTKAKTYPLRPAKGRVPALRIIPINDLERL